MWATQLNPELFRLLVSPLRDPDGRHLPFSKPYAFRSSLLFLSFFYIFYSVQAKVALTRENPQDPLYKKKKRREKKKVEKEMSYGTDAAATR